MSVGIIGCGFIGRGWAICFARAGYDVRLWDPQPAVTTAAIEYIAQMLPDLERRDLLNGQSATQVLSRLVPVDTLRDAIHNASYIQENAPEQLELKQALFAELDSFAPNQAIIASSTSALLPSCFTQDLSGRDRCIVAHPVNPPHLVPLVELVPSQWTSADVLERSEALMRTLGQQPVRVNREVDGFILNRLQAAVLDEAFRLVDAGVASTDSVDACIRDGLARRWLFMGPFETIDLNAPAGVRDYVSRYQAMFRTLTDTMRESVDWSGDVLDIIEKERRSQLGVDDLPARQMWRDRQLMSVANFCRDLR